MSNNHETQTSPLRLSNPLATSVDSLSQYDQDNHPYEDLSDEEGKLVPLSGVFQSDEQNRPSGGGVPVQVVPQVPLSIKTDPVTGLKYVDNYSGLYSKEEVLALHRLEYPIPADFVWEEDITSKSGLMPVASFKYRRDLDASSSGTGSASLENTVIPEQPWEGNFFSRSSRGRGRGRGRRDDHYGDGEMRGSRGGLPYDNAWRTNSEHPYTQDTHSAPLWQSNNPNPTSYHSSYRPNKRQLASSNIYPAHHSDLYQLQEDLSYANERWFYKDPKGHERGPFSSIQMDKWVKHDFFQIELLVRRDNEPGFVLLGNLFIAEQRNPFSLVPLSQWLQGPASAFKNRLIVLIHSYQVDKMQREQANREQQSGTESKGQGESLPSSVASLSTGSSGGVESGLAPPSELEFPGQSNPLSQSGSLSKTGIIEQTAPWNTSQEAINKSSLDPVHNPVPVPVPVPGRSWYEADDSNPTPWGQNYPWSAHQIGQSTAYQPPNVILQEQTKVLTDIVEKMKDKPAGSNSTRKKKAKRAKAKEPKADPQNQKKPSPSESQKSNTTSPSNTVNNANTAVTNTNAKSNPKSPANTQQQSQQKSPPQVKKTKPQYKLKQANEPEEQPKPAEQPAIKKPIKYGKKPQVWKVVGKKEEENEITEGQQDSSLHNTEEKI